MAIRRRIHVHYKPDWQEISKGEFFGEIRPMFWARSRRLAQDAGSGGRCNLTTPPPFDFAPGRLSRTVREKWVPTA